MSMNTVPHSIDSNTGKLVRLKNVGENLIVREFTGNRTKGLFYRSAINVAGTSKQITFAENLNIRRLSVLIVPYDATTLGLLPGDTHGLMVINATSALDVTAHLAGGTPAEYLTGAGGIRLLPLPLNVFLEDFELGDINITTIDVSSGKGASAALTALNFYVWGQPA